MPLLRRRLERHRNTVWAIAASPYVKQYLIGFTARSGYQRFLEYRPLKYDHLVIIADKLNREDAKQLEQYLQVSHNHDRRSAAHIKYNKRRTNNRYYPSDGGGKGKPAALIHSVYMAWWEED
jgi:hypothetical protein